MEEKVIQLKKARVKQETNTLVSMIDHAGQLNEQIKGLTKQLEDIKKAIKSVYTSDMKEIHGDTYKAVFSEREVWGIHPQTWVRWLKKNYTAAKKFNELYVATTKVSISEVRSALGASVIEEIGERGEDVLSLSLKRRD